MSNDNKEERTSLLPIFMCLGSGIGGLVGFLVFDQLIIGMLTGQALALLPSVIFDNKNQ